MRNDAREEDRRDDWDLEISISREPQQAHNREIGLARLEIHPDLCALCVLSVGHYNAMVMLYQVVLWPCMCVANCVPALHSTPYHSGGT